MPSFLPPLERIIAIGVAIHIDLDEPQPVRV